MESTGQFEKKSVILANGKGQTSDQNKIRKITA